MKGAADEETADVLDLKFATSSSEACLCLRPTAASGRMCREERGDDFTPVSICGIETGAPETDNLSWSGHGLSYRDTGTGKQQELDINTRQTD